MIEAMTFRFYGHVFGDADGYMDKAEKGAAMAVEPVPRFRAALIEKGIADETKLSALEAAIDEEIEEAIAFALASPYPDFKELTRDVYAEGEVA